MSHDLKIIVGNETDTFQTIVLFQGELEKEEKGLMFDKIFPYAWQVFDLKEVSELVVDEGTTFYRSSQQIGVDRDTAAVKGLDLSKPEGIITQKANVEPGQCWEYRWDNKAPELIKLQATNEGNLITCKNSYSRPITVDYYNNDARLVCWQTLYSGDEAGFDLKPKISFMYYYGKIKQGDMITKQMVGETVAQDFSNYSKVTLTLTVGEGGKKEWKIEKKY